MTIKEFLAAVREFTDYTAETNSGTGWKLPNGPGGFTIVFRAGTAPDRKIYGLFHAVWAGWEAIHGPKGWDRVPGDFEICADLELPREKFLKLLSAMHCSVSGYSKKLRADLIEACGLVREEREKQEWYKAKREQ